MELLMASAIGVLTASGLYLVLRLRSFPVILGISLLSYATNLFLFSSGRLAIDMPPVLRDGVTEYTDPLPQALVLTAIVISFGMTALVVLLALGAYLSARTDEIDLPRDATGDPAEADAEDDDRATPHRTGGLDDARRAP